MRRTHDYTHHYRGIWRDGARCRIRVYEAGPGDPDPRPVIVCAQLDGHENTSVTNAAELIAAEVVGRHFPALLDAPADGGQPVAWLEHYPARGGLWGRAEYDSVTFTPWRIRVEQVGGVPRRRLGAPDWRRLDTALVRRWLGEADSGDREGPMGEA